MMKIGIIGLGYVGLPLACMFSKKYKVVGFDTDHEIIESLQQGKGHDKSNYADEELVSCLEENLVCTDDLSELSDCNVYIVCVPTPIDDSHNPDLSFLESASKLVGSILKAGDTVIYESSTFPGCTEKVCIPILSSVSGLKYKDEFGVGYSPERINPGDKIHTVEKITKIVSGSSDDVVDFIEQLYNSVLLNGTYKARSIRVAEAAKMVENIQRDVNIALVNELSQVFSAMNISINDVLDCASTKWNFVNVKPGLVGGHCIGVDPYYMIYSAHECGVFPHLIAKARKVNEGMGQFLTSSFLQKMAEHKISIHDSNILILGFAFKANSADIRNTKVADIYHNLCLYTPNISVYDPLACREKVENMYDIKLVSDEDIEKRESFYDAVIICVGHDEFATMDIRRLLKKGGILYDVMNIRNDADFYL